MDLQHTMRSLIRGVPREARALALIVEDPDAPTPNPFVHWLVTGIPPNAQSVGAALTISSRAQPERRERAARPASPR